jgi:hypothetical protein
VRTLVPLTSLGNISPFEAARSSTFGAIATTPSQ